MFEVCCLDKILMKGVTMANELGKVVGARERSRIDRKFGVRRKARVQLA